MSHEACVQGLFSPSVAFLELLDTIPVGILVLDVDRRVVALNRRLREWTGASGVSGRPCWEIMDHSVCRENCPVPEMAPADEVREMKSIREEKNGQSLSLIVTVGPIRDAGGCIVGFLESVAPDAGFPGAASKGDSQGEGFPKDALLEGSYTDLSSLEADDRLETLTWEEVERRLILDALVRSGGKRKDAAKRLGWSRSTLWRKMKARGVVVG